ncbi:helix-turn-helix domain-containing protein [Clostridium phoceensis]|nr:helix-turn-helix domain-containing protein [Clostridium phoceensis]
MDESGHPHKQIAPYMKGRLQSKLMHAIMKK